MVRFRIFSSLAKDTNGIKLSESDKLESNTHKIKTNTLYTAVIRA